MQYDSLNIANLPAKMIEHYAANPVTLENWQDYFVHPIYPKYIDLGTLIDSKLTAEFTQYDISSSRVINILFKGDDCFAKTRTFIQPMTVGVDAAQNIHLDGGRHRLCAMLTLLALSGFDIDTDAVRELQVPINYMPHSVLLMSTDNGSRAMSAQEKSAIKSQLLGIDTDDLDDICAAIVSKKITIGVGASLAYQLLYSETNDSKYTLTTMGDIGTKTIGAFTKLYATSPNDKKLMKHSQQHLATVLCDSYAHLNEAISYCVRTYKSDNVARMSTSIGSRIAQQYYAKYSEMVPTVLPTATTRSRKITVDAEPIIGQAPMEVEQPATVVSPAKSITVAVPKYVPIKGDLVMLNDTKQLARVTACAPSNEKCRGLVDGSNRNQWLYFTNITLIERATDV
jgi:hypothetical protein